MKSIDAKEAKSCLLEEIDRICQEIKHLQNLSKIRKIPTEKSFELIHNEYIELANKYSSLSDIEEFKSFYEEFCVLNNKTYQLYEKTLKLLKDNKDYISISLFKKQILSLEVDCDWLCEKLDRIFPD